jgi:hypothetical protein
MPEVTRKSALLIHKARMDAWHLDDADMQRLADGYASVYLVDRYDFTWEVEQIVERLAALGPLVSLVAPSELDILRAGRLRSRLKIAGQSYDNARIFRDKLLMKNHLAGHGIALPAYHGVESLADVQDFIDLHGYPVVVKPRLGAGSMRVAVLKSREDLQAFALTPHVLDLIEQPTLMVEEFVPGDMLHIDGVQIDGELRLMLAFRYVNGCLAFREQKFLGSVMLDQAGELAQRATALARRVIKSMPLPRHSSFHLELFLTPSQQLVFGEIASRTGGALVPEAIEAATGVNLDRVVALAQSGQQLGDLLDAAQRATSVTGWALIPPRHGILLAAPQSVDCDKITHYSVTGTLPKDCSGAMLSTDAICSFVVSGDSFVEAQAMLVEQVEWIESQMKWAEKTTAVSQT